MFIRSFPGMYALRFPHLSPLEGGGEPSSENIDLAAEFGDDPPADPPAGDPPADPPAGDPPGDPPPAGDPPGEDPPPGDAEDPPAAGDPPPEDPPADGENDPDGDPPASGGKPDWRDRQIIKRNKELADERAEAARLRSENEALKALATPEGGEAPVVVTPEAARAEALQIVRQEQYAKKINDGLKKLDESGTKAFPKSWDTRVAAAAEIFGEEMAKKPYFLEALTDLDNSAAVYHDLTGDPDRLEALLGMSPVKMGVELARLSTKLAARPPVQISRAPAPIVPLAKPTPAERSLEDLSNDESDEAQAEFNRRMEAEERKRFEAQRNR